MTNIPIADMTQIQFEEYMIDAGVKRFLAEQAKGTYKLMPDGSRKAIKEESNTFYGQTLLNKYSGMLADYLSIWKEHSLSGRGRRPALISLLDMIDERAVAFIAVRAVVDHISVTGKAATIAQHISHRLQDQIQLKIFQEASEGHYETLIKDMKRRNVRDYSHKMKVMRHAMQKDENVPVWEPWSVETLVQIGIALIDCIIKSSSDYAEDHKRILFSGLIEQELEHTANNKSTYWIRATQKTLDLINDALDKGEVQHPVNLPCKIKPLDWSTPFDGGYHHPVMRAANPLMKGQSYIARAFIKGIMADAHMPGVYSAINRLQSVQFCINREVFTQLQKERLRADGIKLPPKDQYSFPTCPLPSVDIEDYEDKGIWKQARQDQRENMTADDKAVFGKWSEETRELHTKEEQRKGKWIGVLQTYDVARMLADLDYFYFVYTMDWRGRIYPSCTALSPQSNKFSKALLQFANDCPIGQQDDWLYYISGLWGNDKASLDEQKAWVLDNAENMYQVYIDQDNTRDWWKQADDPWGFLSACVHYGPAVKGMSEGMDVSTWRTKGICYADGKCNGLQHFSMMLRDEEGAEHVNLLPTRKPNDIYGVSADVLLRKVTELAYGSTENQATDQEEQWAQEFLSSGLVTRKLTKTPTMTFTYGGTIDGTRSFLKDWCVENCQGSVTSPKKAGSWITKYVWGAVNETIDKTKQGMQYLRTLAWEVAKHNRPVVWVTPLGLPVMQWYPDKEKDKVKLMLFGKVRVEICLYKDKDNQANRYKMRNSFPPNFVHSMDATHLCMSVNTAWENGIRNICTVHDSFGTQAGMLKEFKQYIRDEFAELYSTDQLERLCQQLSSQNPDIELPSPTACCEYGNLDVNAVRQAECAFM